MPAKLNSLTDEEKNAYEILKKCLISPPILKLPKKGLPYSIDTDACNYQVGVVLLQTYPDGTRHPLGYWSRTLNPAEKIIQLRKKNALR